MKSTVSFKYLSSFIQVIKTSITREEEQRPQRACLWFQFGGASGPLERDMVPSMAVLGLAHSARQPSRMESRL